MQRAIRRSDLPVWETEGFNPHTYITFALPLSLGTEGVCESMDTRLTEDIPLDEVAKRLDKALPNDLKVIRVALPVKKHTEIAQSVYEIVTDIDLNDFRAFLNSEKILVEKKTKRGISEIDLKPHIIASDFKENSFVMTLPSGIDFNLNPSLIFDAYEKQSGKINKLLIKRTRILCKDGADFE